MLETVPKEHDRDTIYIFGHTRDGFGASGDAADVARFRDYLAAVLDHARTQMRLGKSKDEIAKISVLPGFDEYVAPADQIDLASVLRDACDELSAR